MVPLIDGLGRHLKLSRLRQRREGEETHEGWLHIPRRSTAVNKKKRKPGLETNRQLAPIPVNHVVPLLLQLEFICDSVPHLCHLCFKLFPIFRTYNDPAIDTGSSTGTTSGVKSSPGLMNRSLSTPYCRSYSWRYRPRNAISSRWLPRSTISPPSSTRI